jgi:hypothetical protein
VIDDGVIFSSEFEQHGISGYRVQGTGYRVQGAGTASIQQSTFSNQKSQRWPVGLREIICICRNRYGWEWWGLAWRDGFFTPL